MELLEKSKEEGNDLSPDEICDQVLGTRSCYIKSLGYGPKPKGKESIQMSKYRSLRKTLKRKMWR